MESPWTLFRRLCRHYADCLVLEDRPSLRVRPESEGQTWTGLAGAPPWAEVVAGRPFAPVLSTAGVGVVAARRTVDQDTAWLGYPVAIAAGHRGQAWAMPIFAMPVGLQETAAGVRAVLTGPVMANQAWLEEAFATAEERLCFAQAVGLIERRGDQPLAGGDDVPALVQAAAHLLAEQVQEPLTGEPTGTGLRGLRPGVWNRVLLITQSSSRYHRGVVRELLAIGAEASDADLDRSALAAFFRSPASAVTLPEVACLAVLDPSQRRALESGLTQALTVVTGPPGCGKSEVVRHLLINQALAGRPTLMASRNHRALDAVEPGLNALVRTGGLVVRTADREARSTWRDCLAEILERPAGGDDHAWKQARERLSEAVQKTAALEADLAGWRELRGRYEELAAQAADALAALPLHLRSPEARACWQADEDLLVQAEAELDRLGRGQGGGFWRRLRLGEAEPAFPRLRHLAASAPPPFADRPLGEPEDDPAVWNEALEVWRHLAQEQRLRADLIRLEGHLAGLPPPASTLAALVAAADLVRQRLREALEHLAIGDHARLPLEERRRLSALRAAIGTLGPEPWEGAVAQALPVVTRFHPLWACPNLSVGSTLPLAPAIFELVVIDEASQCDLPSVIPLLYRAQRAMVVGDPRQLRHISRLGSLAERRLLQRHHLTGLDIQRFSHGANSCYDLAATVAEPLLLDRHYRSHGQIIGRASRAFYQGRLQVATDEERLEHTDGGPAWRWIEVQGPLPPGPSGVTSPAEAEAIVALARSLEASGFAGSLGVAAPFRAQVELLDRRLRDALSPGFCQRTRLLVATAHGFQGDERDAVAFSLCVGPALTPGAAHFLASTPNLLNVALTRARGLLAIVGDRGWARQSGPPFLKRLAADEEPPAEVPATPYDSPWEARLAQALAEAGIPALPQVAVAGRRLDLAVLDGGLKIDIEVDGTATHRSAAGMRVDDDLWRDRILLARGWTILRFWTFELAADLPGCVGRIQAAVDLARRRR